MNADQEHAKEHVVVQKDYLDVQRVTKLEIARHVVQGIHFPHILLLNNVTNVVLFLQVLLNERD
jgi:hypothetical protein